MELRDVQGDNRLFITIITVYQVVAKFAPDKGQFTAAASATQFIAHDKATFE
jgi:hypothetical protein